MNALKNKPGIRKDLLFVGLLMLISLIYDYQHILFYRPQGIHVWRQTDCLSITDNYYQESAPFLAPQLHIQFSDNGHSGTSLGEFPILYYGIAQLWKITGKEEFVYRLFGLLLSYLGLFCLYRIAYKLTNNWMLACSAPVLLLSSPIFAFYSINFLTNAPAFCLMLIGWYAIARYYETTKMAFFYWACFLFLLIGLLKVSTLMSVFLIPLFMLLEQFGWIQLHPKRKIVQRPWLQFGLLFLVILLVFSWYFYADSYVQQHGGRYSYTRPVTAWNTPKEQLDLYFLHFKESLIHQIHRIGTLVLLLLAAVFLAFQHKKLERFWLIGMPLLVFGYVFFVMLFVYSLDGHDYYHIDFLAPLLFIYLAFIRYLSKSESTLLSSPVFISIFCVFWTFNVMGCANNIQVRYHNCPDTELPYRQIFCSRKEIDLLGYPQWQSEIMKPYGTVEPELRKRGITRNDKFLSMDDGSFNVTLYLMDQKGWPNIEGDISDSTKVIDKIHKGGSFLVYHREETGQMAWLQHFMKYPFLTYENLRIYDLRPYRKL
ncbi:MAG: hypothetical protein RLZZ543_1825 [Bacteroidota bacterium]|jgi:hypothetical protein